MDQIRDIYQVNLSQLFTIEGKYCPFNVFHDLINLNPAPFSAYFRLFDRVLISSSPERFLKLENGILETRPIKGTIPRGNNAEEDKINREMLLNSTKEKAELLMITDLMRNDLGRVSSAGSVETVGIGLCEEYTNVFHSISIHTL